MVSLRTALLWGAGAGAVAALVRKLKMDGTIDSFLERVAFQVVAPASHEQGYESDGQKARSVLSCRPCERQGNAVSVVPCAMLTLALPRAGSHAHRS